MSKGPGPREPKYSILVRRPNFANRLLGHTPIYCVWNNWENKEMLFSRYDTEKEAQDHIDRLYAEGR